VRLPSKRLFGILASIVAGSACLRAAPPATDLDIEAVFLYHFTQFVDWPQAAFASEDAPFTIGVVGPDPFEKSLLEIVKGEMVGRHPIQVREVSDPAAERQCQILYVSKEGEPHFDFSKVRDAPILTVGESDGFIKAGGVVQFFVDRRRIRLRISLSAARSRSLEISAKLLRVAEVTQGGPGTLRFPAIALVPRSEAQRNLAENRALDLLLLRAGVAEFGMGGVQEVLADD
jgi:hypothetical protein